MLIQYVVLFTVLLMCLCCHVKFTKPVCWVFLYLLSFTGCSSMDVIVPNQVNALNRTTVKIPCTFTSCYKYDHSKFAMNWTYQESSNDTEEMVRNKPINCSFIAGNHSNETWLLQSPQVRASVSSAGDKRGIKADRADQELCFAHFVQMSAALQLYKASEPVAFVSE